jgi:hypothetical protein
MKQLFAVAVARKISVYEFGSFHENSSFLMRWEVSHKKEEKSTSPGILL